MVLPAPAQLPVGVLARLVAIEELGELHPTLAPTATWSSVNHSDPMRDELAEHLTVLGWRHRDGSLEREVAAALTVLCRATTEYYGWLTHDGTTTAVLAAATAKEGVLALRRPDATVWLSSIPASRLAERLIAQTPDVQPGHGAAVTIALADLHATNRSGRTRAPGGVIARRADSDVRHTQRLLALPTTGAGELSAGVRDNYGRRHEQSLCYVDTTYGRYLVITRPPGTVLVSPASSPDLVAQLRTTHDRLNGIPLRA